MAPRKQAPKKIDPAKVVEEETVEEEVVEEPVVDGSDGEDLKGSDTPVVEVVESPVVKEKEKKWFVVEDLTDDKLTVEAANALTHGHQKKGVLLRMLSGGDVTGQIIFIDGVKITNKGILK